MIVKHVEPVASIVFSNKDEYSEWLQEINDLTNNGYAIAKKKKLDYKLEEDLLDLADIDVAIDKIYVEHIHISLDGDLAKSDELKTLMNGLAFHRFGIEKDRSLLRRVFWHNITGNVNEYMLYRLWERR